MAVYMNDPQASDQAGERPGKPAPDEEQAVDPKTLSPEEQMERYEQELKESDWGHQPC